MNVEQAAIIDLFLRKRTIYHSSYNRCVLDSEIGSKKEFDRVLQHWSAARKEHSDLDTIFAYLDYRQAIIQRLISTYDEDRYPIDHSLEYYKGSKSELDFLEAVVNQAMPSSSFSTKSRHMVVHLCLK